MAFKSAGHTSLLPYMNFMICLKMQALLRDTLVLPLFRDEVNVLLITFDWVYLVLSLDIISAKNSNDRVSLPTHNNI
jgi:hypothetical protein